MVPESGLEEVGTKSKELRAKRLSLKNNEYAILSTEVQMLKMK